MTMHQLKHPTAVVEAGAEIGDDVSIGPFCHIGRNVVIRDRVEIAANVVVTGYTTIGEGTRVFPQAVLGCEPQNTGHRGGKTTLTIGKDCTIREGVTMHVGTDNGRGETIVGDNGMFLANSHIAHDCIVGSNVTIVNNSALAGHCEIGDHVSIAGLSGVHQFVRIGRYAFVAGLTRVEGDVIPYGMVHGSHMGGNLRGLNVVGIKRSGLPRSELRNLRRAYSMLFEEGGTLLDNADQILKEFPESEAVAEVSEFISGRQKRQYCVPNRNKSRGEDLDESG